MLETEQLTDVFIFLQVKIFINILPCSLAFLINVEVGHFVKVYASGKFIYPMCKSTALPFLILLELIRTISQKSLSVIKQNTLWNFSCSLGDSSKHCQSKATASKRADGKCIFNFHMDWNEELSQPWTSPKLEAGSIVLYFQVCLSDRPLLPLSLHL